MIPLLAVVFACAAPARAEPPLATDDARVMDKGKCHLEGMLQRQRGGRESHLEFACNFTGSMELALGHERSRSYAGGGARANLLQAKLLLQAMEPQAPGYGIAFGIARARPDGRPGQSEPYANLIGGVSLPGTRAALQANLGVARDQSRRQTHGTWGFAGEYSLTPGFEAVAESAGQRGGKPVLLAGLRAHAIPETLQISFALGNRRSEPAKGRFAALGFHLEY